ncbi:DNA segregation ATPase FtsK/SpoIIIE, S-DNA-T family [Gracilibacillus ureilyticus]|uniref:DNA segregation ATPase FtsK/SpoIIIE, S-DNA-T family n=1 Tax=Gracilibacillus ureilyticus TaxID=531814 RepID=A0A1H9TDE5_9BACI|nr:DNA translocase FtsK [Gracilibacillus ureilyticus]SER95057.1 DNA segregation ATPase FtsK/SpoIIIE, S-DNA-T family [Gracilibacillus ureilyticus]
MWKNIKNKWDHLFEEESVVPREDHSSKEVNRSSSMKSVETKMAYQYPKNNNQPIYQPKRTVTSERKAPVKDSNSDQKSTHTPFKVSHVPSPIHGFNQNKAAGNHNKLVEAAMEKSNDQTDMGLKSKEIKENHLEEVKEDILPPSPPVMEDEYIHSNEMKNTRETTQSSIKTGEKIRPINVIMTPRDKRKRREQQHQTNFKQQVEQVHQVQQVQQTHRTESKVTKQLPYHLLNDTPDFSVSEQTNWVNQQSETLQLTLNHFSIRASVVGATQGPSVTRFEIQPEPGVKVSKIKNLSDDIKLNLAAKDIRMEAPIPGKNTIGIEVPNDVAQPVFLQKMLESRTFQDPASPLTVALGADIEGRPIVTDLQKMPHGLIAGATGSGKSVCINTILVSLLYKANHEDVKFLLIDPKMVELTPYNDIPHLVAPVITDVKAATSALKWAVNEMENRYQKFVKETVRDLSKYNEKMEKMNRYEDKLPYLVIVIDELADLMMTSPQDVEDAICRIAQKARACGIHLLIATQRPSVDVITGLIKANVPTRIAFSVSSQVDSRTILDSAGAEKLLGKGDMLFVENGSGDMKRIQGAFVSDEEIERITHYVKQMAEPNYLFEQEQLIEQVNSSSEVDELYDEAIDFVLEYNGASASLLQRRFKIGYNRAARLIDSMEQDGIISGQNGSKQREILINRHDLDNLYS